MRTLWRGIKDKWISKAELIRNLSKYQDIMFADIQFPPHPFVQSAYIVLWANADIYFAMNYILSPFCQSLDEVAIVTLLKQLTVFWGEDIKFLEIKDIIRAIWNGLYHQPDLKRAVLYFGTRNVASFSLMTLAVHNITSTTFIRLFEDSMVADQRISLNTYDCIARNLGDISKRDITARQLTAIDMVWQKVSVLLTNNKEKREWITLMLHICNRFKMGDLAGRVWAYVMDQRW